MKCGWLMACLAAFVFSGCNAESSSDTTGESASSPAATANQDTKTAGEDQAEGGEEDASDMKDAVRAKVGVAAKGRSLDDDTGVIVESAKSLFAFSEKAVFDIKIPSAVKLFEGAEGRKPNSHEEYMSRIIEANNITLPQLLPGKKYRYDPERGELMVVSQSN